MKTLHFTLLFIALAVTAGCIGGPQVTTSEAKERALMAEEDHIEAQLENASCVDSWSFQSFGGIPENATIHNTTADAVYVSVTHPYTYSTQQVNADVGSEAMYRVTVDDTERVEGTAVSPC